MIGPPLDDLVIERGDSRGWYSVPVPTEAWTHGFARMLKEERELERRAKMSPSNNEVSLIEEMLNALLKKLLLKLIAQCDYIKYLTASAEVTEKGITCMATVTIRMFEDLEE